MDRNGAKLLAEKLTRELFRIAQAYGKSHTCSFEDLTHDLAVMLERNALNSVSLKFYRAQHGGGRRSGHEILVEYNYALHAGRPRFHLDDAQGMSFVPLRPPFEMGLVINRDTQGGAYAHRLRINWGDAPAYHRDDGFAHRDGNTTRRTGGRASKEIYMDHTLRRHGRIKFFLPAKNYGFISAQDGTDIFFHKKNLQGFEPCRGQRVSFLPLVTPRGVQAKDVRLG
jgi:cold shock CspA family protein